MLPPSGEIEEHDRNAALALLRLAKGDEPETREASMAARSA